MYHYNYTEFKNDTRQLAQRCRPFHADTIVGIARGGLMLSQALGYALNIRNIQSVRAESYDGTYQRDILNLHVNCDLSTSERVLIVDDIVDSGATLQLVLETLTARHPNILFKSATLFYKPTASLQSDFTLHEATQWITFFWERDFNS